MAVEGRIRCTNYAIRCHRLATTEVTGRPFCPPCASGADLRGRGYVKSRYNEDVADLGQRSARVVVTRLEPRDAD